MCGGKITRAKEREREREKSGLRETEREREGVCACTGKLVGGPFVDEHSRFLKRTVTLAVEFVGVFGRERHVLKKQKLQLNNGVGHQIFDL